MHHRSHRALALASVLLVVLVSPAAAAGKPGYPDRITWNGLSWQVKTSRAAVGPGPNVFSKANVSVDAAGRLHLRIARVGDRWTAAEIIGPQSYGYGTYTFTLASDVSALDPNVVLGLFTWSDKPQQAHREIDIEFARWGSAADPTNAQFVVQPHDAGGHLYRFEQPAGAPSVHSFTWTAGRVSFRSGAASFTYSGADVPKPGDERVRLNLWLFEGRPPTDGQAVEVVVESFAFTPA